MTKRYRNLKLIFHGLPGYDEPVIKFISFEGGIRDVMAKVIQLTKGLSGAKHVEKARYDIVRSSINPYVTRNCKEYHERKGERIPQTRPHPVAVLLVDHNMATVSSASVEIINLHRNRKRKPK